MAFDIGRVQSFGVVGTSREICKVNVEKRIGTRFVGTMCVMWRRMDSVFQDLCVQYISEIKKEPP